MSIQVAIRHRTTYEYERPIVVGPQLIRLRPTAHCRTPILSYSLNVSPDRHFLNWQQDPLGNFQARAVFPNTVRQLTVDVDFIADLTVINPFDFFLEQESEDFPFAYGASTIAELTPFLEIVESGPLLNEFTQSIDLTSRPTIDFLVDLNQLLHRSIDYKVRYEPGVQSCEETLEKRQGSCRDSAFLLVQILRHIGLAARFSSGYLVQLTSDESSTEEPNGIEEDVVDLHAWAEVYLPGAGWIGLDPTSGLLAGEGHIPLACTPTPDGAAPISGSREPCNTTFKFSLTVKRIHETPRPSRPYTEVEWQRVMSLGHDVDALLSEYDVRLTMGGEPTFVSVNDMESPQWRTEAIGEDKTRLANQLTRRLQRRFARGGLLYFGQGKQYPGELLPRWAMRCFWRADGRQIWDDDRWQADVKSEDQFDNEHAQLFIGAIANRLGLNPDNVLPAHERTETKELTGCVLPLQMRWWESPRWQSERWECESLELEPGDSPMGYRLPLDALAEGRNEERELDFFPNDPLDSTSSLPTYEQLCERVVEHSNRRTESVAAGTALQPQATHWSNSDGDPGGAAAIHTALCVEPRFGSLHVFLPPIDRLEYFLELIAAIELTASSLNMPVIIEGYPPPEDRRLRSFAVTPDPGVIEVNIHPAANWEDLSEITTGVYEEARQTSLGAERFETDGTHTSTGGGNHVVLGGATPEDSPFLRRPDLLKSFIAYWHNHPSLSYFFSGRFVGPTSQAPRIDEGSLDSLHELEIALEQIQPNTSYPPWHVDRVLRRFLMDRTGNRHRSEFCIDKLFAPECINGRLGLLELRAFEMPPHARMSLVQQLLIRSLVTRFWDQPYEAKLVDWGSTLHDRFMLPCFLWQDLCDVLEETRRGGIDFDHRWFEPHREFRFPKVGSICEQSVELEIRLAIEPWYVIGDETGGAARYVDSSTERLQVLVRGMTNPRHKVSCNGRQVPLHPTGVEGEFVAGVRFRAWQPPSCMHPMIPVDDPVTFDLVDTWMNQSLGGCRYHVGHPAGLNPSVFPVNGNEAESRRAARFVTTSHTSGPIFLPPEESNAKFPLTLDLRKHHHLA